METIELLRELEAFSIAAAIGKFSSDGHAYIHFGDICSFIHKKRQQFGIKDKCPTREQVQVVIKQLYPG